MCRSLEIPAFQWNLSLEEVQSKLWCNIDWTKVTECCSCTHKLHFFQLFHLVFHSCNTSLQTWMIKRHPYESNNHSEILGLTSSSRSVHRSFTRNYEWGILRRDFCNCTSLARRFHSGKIPLLRPSNHQALISGVMWMEKCAMQGNSSDLSNNISQYAKTAIYMV